MILFVIASYRFARLDAEWARAACLDIANLRDGHCEPLSQLPTRHGQPGETLPLFAARAGATRAPHGAGQRNQVTCHAQRKTAVLLTPVAIVASAASMPTTVQFVIARFQIPRRLAEILARSPPPTSPP